MGKSMSNGAGPNNAMGPAALYPKNGWPIQPVRSWDFTMGRDPE